MRFMELEVNGEGVPPASIRLTKEELHKLKSTISTLGVSKVLDGKLIPNEGIVWKDGKVGESDPFTVVSFLANTKPDQQPTKKKGVIVPTLSEVRAEPIFGRKRKQSK